MTSLGFLALFGLVIVPAFARETYFYYKASTGELGALNHDAASGNPLKGLVANPDFDHDPSITSIDSSMDIWYLGLDKVMVDDPDRVGLESAFDWSEVENRLEKSKSNRRHAILTFNIHYPGQPLRLPKHIQESDLTLHWYPDLGGGLTPDYGESTLLNAIEQFIREFGRLYNGDQRLAYVHLGLLGFWGEWHTHTSNNLIGLVPDFAKERVTNAFLSAFPDTKLQGRYPGDFRDNNKIGLYDASFGYNTLDGEYNGGVSHKEWYFWPVIEGMGRADFWRTAPMGAETRPELQSQIFEPWYPAGTYQHQDFVTSMEVTHCTYVFHSDAFVNGGYSGSELDAARFAHSRLGYGFMVSGLDVAAVVGFNLVEIDVTVMQVGIAPFYYSLGLSLSCDGYERTLWGVDFLIDYGHQKTYTFNDVPAIKQCLRAVSVSLKSAMELPGRMIKFSQGDGYVELDVPLVWEVNSSLGNSEGWGELPRLTMVRETKHGEQEMGSLHDGDILVRSTLSLRAEASDRVGGVVFMSGPIYFSDFARPFVLFDRDFGFQLLNEAGWKTLTIRTLDYGGGVIGERTISFEIVNERREMSTRTASVVGHIEEKSPVSHLSVLSYDWTDDSTKIHDPIHGFNTPATPTLLQIAATERELQTHEVNIHTVGKSGVRPFSLLGYLSFLVCTWLWQV